MTDEAAPQPEEKAFAMDYWLAYAKDYAVSIGLVLDVLRMANHLPGAPYFELLRISVWLRPTPTPRSEVG